jgi:hypothetical protein
MNMDDREQTLHELARSIEQRHLSQAARLLLDTIEPMAFLASQAALFARPFLPPGRWHSYVEALGEESGWSTLRRIINR